MGVGERSEQGDDAPLAYIYIYMATAPSTMRNFGHTVFHITPMSPGLL